MRSDGLLILVDALEALGLAEGVARELADRRGVDLVANLTEHVRQAIREEMAKDGGSPSNTGGFVTVAEAARHAGVTPGTIRDWLAAGKITTGSKAGRRWRVKLSDLEAFMRQQAGGTGARVDLESEAGRLLSLDKARTDRS